MGIKLVTRLQWPMNYERSVFVLSLSQLPNDLDTLETELWLWLLCCSHQRRD